MIYHKQGIDWPKDKDPYEFGEEGTRPLNKLAVNIMLNSAKENFAVHAISDEFKKDEALLKKFGTRITSYSYIKKLTRACKELHHQIEDSFSTGIGLDLQYEDSCMMMDILEELMNQGIPAISVHDSVMVGESHKELVLKLMHDKYVERYGFEPKIK